MDNSKLRSAVWGYFKKLDNDFAKCKTCCLDMKVKAGNTSNLKRHLEMKHFEEFKKLKKDMEAKPKSENGFRQETLQEILNKAGTKEKTSLPSERGKKITNSLAKMVCVDLQPFSIVEDSGFRDFVYELEPRYELPSRHTLSEIIIPKLYKDKKEVLLLKTLKEAKSICLTTDTWTSKSTTSFLALTAHYVDCEMQLISVCLAARPFPENHTAQNIAELVKNILEENNIFLHKSEVKLYIVTDNAKNFTNAVEILGIEGRTCFAHTLQLVVHDGLKKFRGIETVLGKCRSIVGHFKRSTVATALLKKTQQQMSLLEHKLKQDVVTRWNSTYYMLERLVEQKSAISYILALDEKVACLQLHEWTLIENMVSLLKPFELVTEMLSGCTYPTCSMIIPALHQLERNLEKHQDLNDLRDIFIQLLHERWPQVKSDNVFAVSTFLDPRFKLVCFSSEHRETIINMVIKLCVKQSNVSVSNRPHSGDVGVVPAALCTETGSESGINSKIKKKALFWSSFKDLVEEEYSREKAENTPIIRNEINSYLLLNPIDICQHNTMSPLKWWKDNEHQFPHLFALARKMLCISATSVASERVFSKAGLTFSERRQMMKESKVEQLVFLNTNWNVGKK